MKWLKDGEGEMQEREVATYFLYICWSVRWISSQRFASLRLRNFFSFLPSPLMNDMKCKHFSFLCGYILFSVIWTWRCESGLSAVGAGQFLLRSLRCDLVSLIIKLLNIHSQFLKNSQISIFGARKKFNQPESSPFLVIFQPLES